MGEARKKTQAALQGLFDVIVSRATIEPQIELTTIVNWLESSIADMRKKQKQKDEGDAKTSKATSGTGKPVTKTESGDDKKGTSDASKDASQEGKSDEKNGSGTKSAESAATTDGSGTKSAESAATTDGSGTKSTEPTATTDGSGTKSNEN